MGRRGNVDPILKEWESSYLCFGGNPILFSDVNGDDIGPGDDPRRKNYLYNKAIQIAAIRVHNQIQSKSLNVSYNCDIIELAVDYANSSMNDGWFDNGSYTREEFVRLTSHLYEGMRGAAFAWGKEFESLYSNTIFPPPSDKANSGDYYGLQDYGINQVVTEKIEELNSAFFSVVSSGADAALFIASAPVGLGTVGKGPKPSTFSNSIRNIPILSKPASSGGRLGSEATKKLHKNIIKKFEDEGWTHINGLNKKEFYFKPLGGKGKKGGSYTDLTFTRGVGKNKQTVHINTVDRGSYSGMSKREFLNAKRIRKQIKESGSNAILITIPK